MKLKELVSLTDIVYLMANYTRLMDSMAKSMLREVCHDCIMKKVEEEFENQTNSPINLLPDTTSKYEPNADMTDRYEPVPREKPTNGLGLMGLHNYQEEES